VRRALRGRTPPESAKAALCRPGGTPLQKATRLDFETTMADDYLVKLDRASMLASLEMRAPFLDHRVVEFAFGRVPDALRAAGGERKILLRRVARRLLPPDLDLRRKQGFSLPLAEWLRGPWGRHIESVLMEADPELFSRDALRRLIAAQRNGLANAHRLFALTMLELWRREYRVALPAAARPIQTGG
jgi:asparagine synthase (glutamine-hydrolysing)